MGGADVTSLAQSLVDAAAEAARKAFHETIVGFVANPGTEQAVYTPEEIHIVFHADEPGPWERVARAVLEDATPEVTRRVLFEHADRLMAAAAELYRFAQETREA